MKFIGVTLGELTQKYGWSDVEETDVRNLNIDFIVLGYAIGLSVVLLILGFIK